MKLLKTKKNFRKEFKRQMRYAIAAAVGFMIIFAWRDAIIESTRNLIEKIADKTAIAATNVATALVITIVGVLLILLSSKLLKD
ncbi:MAG: DUF5654 family protein [Nanoarchaeota archaeon]